MRIGLVLCGGGAKGAYQIGCWKALKEVGMDKFAVVSGTSVGALNGALIAMGDYQQAEKIWMELTEKHVLLTTEARKLLVKFVFGVMLILGTLFYHIKMIFVLFAVPVFFTVYVIWLFMHPHGMPAFGPLEMWFFDVMTIGGLLFLWWNAFYLFQDYYQTSTYSFGRIFVRTFIPKLAVLLGRWLPIGINYPLLNLIKSNLNTKQLRESDITLYCTVSVATKYRVRDHRVATRGSRRSHWAWHSSRVFSSRPGRIAPL